MPSSITEATVDEAKLVMDTVKESIDGASGALSLYDKLVERIIPWKDFNETIVELDKFRKDYSNESGQLLGEIKTHMMNGINAYFIASEVIYEWASLSASQLKLFIKLFSAHGARRSEAQKQILVKILDSGIKKMTTAQEELGKSSSSFNSGGGRLSLLRSRFLHEFDEKSEYFKSKVKKIRIGSYIGSAIFGIPGIILGPKLVNKFYIRKLKKKMNKVKLFYDNLDEKVAQATVAIEDTKKILKTEIQHISDLKIQTQRTEFFVNLDSVPDFRDTIISSANDLIDRCESYKTRHINKNDLA